MLRIISKYLKWSRNISVPIRFSSGECGSGSGKEGLVVGVYSGKEGEVKMTQTAYKINADSGGKLKELVTGGNIQKGMARVFTNISNDYSAVAVGGLGPEGAGWNDMEALDECKENIRIAAAVATRALQDEDMASIHVEPFTNAEAAAEGALLSIWRYQDLRAAANRLSTCKVDLYGESDRDGWERGKIKADNQNLARKIEDTPSNLMTPRQVAEFAIDNLCPCGVAVDVRDIDWLETKRWNAFLSISKGSCEPPMFLEIGYCGGSNDAAPIILIGKGITFDSGGLCLKKCEGMSEYRGDVAGAAVVIAAMKCAAQFALPMNIIGYVPLCENCIGAMSTKPGDIVVATNGRSITIDDTDNEGRVILAEPLLYTAIRKPCAVLEVSTHTPGIRRCLGTSASGTFTIAQEIWRELERAGGETGDRLWRMPFWKIFRKKITDFLGSDLHNVGQGKDSGAVCKAAAFNWEFCPLREYIHMDISGTGLLSNGVGHPYLREGTMTGRPVRTIVQFLYQISCPHTRGDEC